MAKFLQVGFAKSSISLKSSYLSISIFLFNVTTAVQAEIEWDRTDQLHFRILAHKFNLVFLCILMFCLVLVDQEC